MSIKQVEIAYEGFVLLYAQMGGVSDIIQDYSLAAPNQQNEKNHDNGIGRSDTLNQFEYFCNTVRSSHIDYSEKWERKKHDNLDGSKSFSNAKPSIEEQNDSNFKEAAGYPDYLYSPLTWLSCDNTDKGVGLVLADRLEFAHELNTNICVDSDKITMAFCPDPEKLMIPIGLEEAEIIGSDFTKQYPFLISASKVFLNTNSLPPLQTFTKIRLNFLSTVGPALWIQRALYAAIILKVETMLQVLKADEDYYGAVCGEEWADTFWNINDFKLTLLDTQDWAEISILIHTHDFRISSAIVGSISALTFEDLLFAAKQLNFKAQLEQLLDSTTNSSHAIITGVHNELTLVSKDKNKVSESDCFESNSSLKLNHLTTAMYTLSQIRREFYEEELRRGRKEAVTTYFTKRLVKGVNGSMLYPVVKLDGYEGHDKELYHQIDQFFSDENPFSSLININQNKFVMIENGRFDGALYPNYFVKSDNSSIGSTISIQDFILLDSKLKKLLDNKPLFDSDFQYPNNCSYNLRRSWYKINIPVTKFLLNKHVSISNNADDEPRETSNIYVKGILEIVIAKAFGQRSLKNRKKQDILFNEFKSHLKKAKKNKTHSPIYNSIDLSLLNASMRILAIESILSGEIISLFKSFEESLKDSHTMASVIDLWDAFIALYEFLILKACEMADNKEVLANDLEHHYTPMFGFYTPALPFVGVKRSDIENYLNTLKASLTTRMRDNLEREGTRLSSVSSRMASMQLLSASDALIKCGGGILRRYHHRTRSTKPGGNSPIGEHPVFATLTSDPGVSVKQMLLDRDKGPKDKYMGAAISINIDHLTHSDSLCAYFHEIGHLLYPFFLDSEINPAVDEFYAANIEEIFCDQLVLNWVFGNDFELYQINYISAALTTPSVKHDGYNCTIQFRVREHIDYLIRLYFITLHVRLERGCSNIDAEANSISDFTEDFMNWVIPLMDEYYPQLFGYIKDCEKHKIVKEAFEYNCNGYSQTTRQSWKFIHNVSNEHVFNEEETTTSKDEILTWTKYIEHSFSQGSAISRYNFNDDEYKDKGFDIFLNPLTLARLSMYCLSRLHLGENGLFDVKSYVARNQYGNINFNNSRTTTHTNDKIRSILDARRCGYFSVSAKTSEAILKSQIASIKTFWDISGYLKTRRLKELVKRSRLNFE